MKSQILESVLTLREKLSPGECPVAMVAAHSGNLEQFLCLKGRDHGSRRERNQNYGFIENGWIFVFAIVRDQRKVGSQKMPFPPIEAGGIRSAVEQLLCNLNGKSLVKSPSRDKNIISLFNDSNQGQGSDQKGKPESVTQSSGGSNPGVLQGVNSEGFMSCVVWGEFHVDPESLLTLGNKEEKTTHGQKEGGQHA